MLRTFVVEYSDGRQQRIKAACFKDYGGYGYCFYTSAKRAGDSRAAEAMLKRENVVRIVPQDMLVASFEDSSLLPEIADSSKPSIDFARDTFFSDAQKNPFTTEERETVSLALKVVRSEIHDKFSPSQQQQAEIDSKIEYLERKVKELDKFNWKRLLITVLVGISVDLGFGTLIPAPLLNIFKEVFSQFIGRLTKKSDPIESND